MSRFFSKILRFLLMFAVVFSRCSYALFPLLTVNYIKRSLEMAVISMMNISLLMEIIKTIFFTLSSDVFRLK